MKNLATDIQTNDVVLGSNLNLNFNSTTQEWLAQKIESNLRTYFGEIFHNDEIGVPWIQEILGKKKISNSSSIIQNYMREISGVKEILEFGVEYDSSNRDLPIDWKVEASEIDDQGQVIVEGTTVL